MKYFTSLSIFLIALTGFSQNQRPSNPSGIPNRGCGTMEVARRQMVSDPRMVEIRRQIEEQTQHFINSQGASRSSMAVVNIPVVFHVVYNNASENIPDYRLLDQLQVLNDDYRKINADTGNVPSVWKTIAADCQINFCLAQRDPSGNPTTGITRTSTSTTSFTDDDKVKFTSQGGINIWDRSKYLNIWVCDLGSSLLGYAQFPGGPSSTDGVVIHYLYTGNNTSTFPYDKGRTLTHEVGHWLNLYHIWGDDGGACSGSDAVTDTPNQADEHYGCYAPGSVQTDACNSSAPGTMWMNYMDYTDDACMYMFTNGQKTRIQSLFGAGGSRLSLATSNGCTPVAALDAAITSISQPDGATCNLTSSPVVTITNKGTGLLTSATINYNIDGGANSTYSWSGSLANGGSETITLPAITSVAGAHTLNAFTSVPNGGVDQLTANDSYSHKFTLIGAAAPLALPFSEGFQSVTFPPTGWTLVNTDANNTWTRVTTAGGFGSSSASAKMDNFSGLINISPQTDDLISPRLDLSSANSTLALTFNVAHVRYSNAYTDSLFVEVSNDCGVSWQNVYKKGGTDLRTKLTDQTTAFTPTNTQWRTETVSLSSFAGEASSLIRFRNYSGSGNNIYIDDINVSYNAAAPLAAFTAADTSICVGSSISFTDESTNSPNAWGWSITGPAGQSSSLQNPTLIFNTAGTYTVSLTATNGTGSNTLTKNSYITVNAVPSAPSVSTPLTYCQNSAASPLTAGGTNLLWYTVSSGGTGSATAPTPSTSSVGTTTYYVSQSSGSCEGSRDSIDVVVNSTPSSPVVSTPVNYCENATASALSATGSGLLWYTVSSGGTGSATAPTPSTVSAGTITYYVSQTSGGCESSRDSIEVIVNAIPASPAVSSPVILCENSASSALTATGSNLLWYTTSSGGTGSTTAPTPSTTPTGTTTYYVSQTFGGCESTRDSIQVDVNPVPSSPSVSTPVTYCQYESSSALTATGTGLLWYSNSSGGTGSSTAPSPSTLVSGTFPYYVSQTSGSCESSRSAIDVVINSSPSTPIITTPVNYCQNEASSPLSATGSNLIWYSTSTGGTGSATAPSPSTASSGTTSYFVSQTVAGCEGLRAQIDVVTDSLPSADFSFSSTGANATFTNNSLDGSSFAWDFGDGSSSTAADTVHTYAAAGTYTITLVATNNCGADTISKIATITITGINNISQNEEWRIYPNPSKGLFYVTGPVSAKKITFNIYNSIGKLVKEVRSDNHSVMLDFSENANGIYYMVGINGNDVVTQKFSIVH